MVRVPSVVRKNPFRQPYHFLPGKLGTVAGNS